MSEPVAAQEAEAREAVLEAYEDSGKSPTFETDEAFDAAFLAALDAYASAIRASEQGRYAVLEAAVMEWRDAFESQSGSSFVERIERLEAAELSLLAVAAALAALEEAGSA